MASNKPPAPVIVGIGASAGGLAAFKDFFAAMPADTGMAFVLVQHLDPHHQSMLVELLRPQTSDARRRSQRRHRCCRELQSTSSRRNATLTIEGGFCAW